MHLRFSIFELKEVTLAIGVFNMELKTPPNLAAFEICRRSDTIKFVNDYAVLSMYST